MNANQQFLDEFMKSVDLSLFTPSLYEYFDDYLGLQKVRKFDGQYVINSFIPPFPGRAFDRFLEGFFGKEGRTKIQSADLAVTNACMFQC